MGFPSGNIKNNTMTDNITAIMKEGSLIACDNNWIVE
jgi:hypothetical protein